MTLLYSTHQELVSKLPHSLYFGLNEQCTVVIFDASDWQKDNAS